jgi:hypothetical protein
VYDPVAQAEALSTASPPTTIRRVKSHPRLTDAQMEAIQGLLNRNVPVAVIANLMETMLNAPAESLSERAEIHSASEMGILPM